MPGSPAWQGETPPELFFDELDQLDHGFFAGASARDQQKWAPVLRPIAR
jgi:hypothetical protein